MGRRLNSLRGNYVLGSQNGDTPTPREVMGTMVSRLRPNAMPSCRKAGLGLGVYLQLAQLMLLSEEYTNALGTQPCDSVSGATHTCRSETEFSKG